MRKEHKQYYVAVNANDKIVENDYSILILFCVKKEDTKEKMVMYDSNV